MRWGQNADGVGPDYCRDCKASRGEPTTGERCGECPEPMLMEENYRAVEVFIDCQTQLQRNQMGYVVSMNYPGVKAAFELMGIPRKEQPRIFSKMQVLEQAFIETESERAKIEADE